MRLSRAAITTLLVAGSLVSSEARAQNYYWPEDKPGTLGAKATYAYTSYATLYSTNTYYFDTRNLSPGADTVFHIFQGLPANGSMPLEIQYNDNCGSSPRSCINWFRPPVSGTYLFLIYAKGPDYGGRGGMTFDIYGGVNGGPIGKVDGPVELGGYVIDTGETYPGETVETVEVNDGVGQTALIRLDWSVLKGHYLPTKYDYTGGVGNMSKLSGPTTAGPTRWLISIANKSVPRLPVRIVRNDAALRDADQDGLGDNLEAELCTCSGTTGSVCGFSCSLACAGGKDTDCDGLRDDAEAVGQEGSTTNYFPLWGASPRHKDMFVEIDRANWNGQAPAFSQADAEWVAARFKPPYLTGISNPDGIDGIAVHFDVDHTCTEPGDTDGFTSACGIYGGAGFLSAWTGCEEEDARSHAREGKFHWVLMMYEDTSGAGNLGYSAVWGRSACITPTSAFGTTSAKQAMLHALGHNLGLNHWGGTDETEGVAERKAIYQSVMNQSYVYTKNGTTDGVSFSQGPLAGTYHALDPGLLYEGSYSSADLSFLANPPYSFPVSGNSVDWNRDGTYEASGVAVAAHVQPEPMKDDQTGVDQPMRQLNMRLPAITAAGGPALARFFWFDLDLHAFDATWVLVNNGQGDIALAKIFSDGSVSSWANTPRNGFTFRGVSEPPTEPAMAYFDPNGTGHPLTFYAAVDTNDVVHYGMFQNGIPSAPPAADWSSVLPTSIIGDPNRQVHFTSVSMGEAGNRLYVVGRDRDTDEVFWGYFAYSNGTFPFTGWTQAQYLGAPIKSADVTPASAGAPNGLLYVAVKGPVLQPRAGNLRLYSFDGAAWAPASDGLSFWQENHSDFSTIRGRPSMTFAHHRELAGSNYVSLPNGSLWLWYAAEVKRTGSSPTYPAIRYRWSWGPFNDSTLGFPNNMGKWHWSEFGPTSQPDAPDQPCFGTAAYGAVGLAVEEQLSPADDYRTLGLQAAVLDTATSGCPQGGGVFWVQFADGQFPVTAAQDAGLTAHYLADHDDRHEISAYPGTSSYGTNLCTSLYRGCPQTCADFVAYVCPSVNSTTVTCNAASAD